MIAIDGEARTGKSTACRLLAARFAVPFLESGVLYRLATAIAIEGSIDPSDGPAIIQGYLAARVNIIGGQTVETPGLVSRPLLRTPGVDRFVGTISSHAGLRSEITNTIRTWAEHRGGDVVVEGRDIGTRVCPDAMAKFYLVSNLDAKVHRGGKQADAASPDEVRKSILERDRQDSSRPLDPMAPAVDAVVIDTSDLSPGQVLEAMAIVVLERGYTPTPAARSKDRPLEPPGLGFR